MEVAYFAKVEPQPLRMVREMNKTYTVEVELEINQHFDVFDQDRSREITH